MIDVDTYGVMVGMDTKASRLREARINAGFQSAAAAARRLGIKPSTYTAHENGQNEYSEGEAMVYGSAFNESWQYLLTGVRGLDEPHPSFPPSRIIQMPKRGEDGLKSGYNPPPDFFGKRDLPVYSAVEGGPGEMVVTTDPIDWVARPWYLGEVKDGFAVLVVGESMVPAYRPGDLAIVNPRVPMMRGKDHILISDDENGTFKATIKHIQNWNEKDWTLEQYKVPQGGTAVFKLPRLIWNKALRVVGKLNE